MLARFDHVQRSMAVDVSSRETLQRWHRRLTRKLKQLIGYHTFQRCDLRPTVTDSVPCDGYVRHRVEIDTEPNVRMPMFVLVPNGLKPGERRPAVIAPHGHGTGGKYGIAGVRDDPDVVQGIERFNCEYGCRLVEQGFIVFCPDARGHGERQEPSLHRGGRKTILASTCQYLNQMGVPLGRTVTGMWTWDLSRLLDYIELRDDCDPTRIGCAGLSGGGLQTLWISALDSRIRCAVVSGYFYGYKQSLLELHWNCSCNYVPHLWEHADIGDIAALIAPRPLLIQTGDQDLLNGRGGLDNVKPQVHITQQAYDLLGVPDALTHDVFAGEHRWDNQVPIPWLCEQLHR